MYVSMYVSEETVSLQRLPNALLMFPHSEYKSFQHSYTYSRSTVGARKCISRIDVYRNCWEECRYLWDRAHPWRTIPSIHGGCFSFSTHLLSCLFFGTKPQNITRHEFDLTQKHHSHSPSKSAAIYPTHTSHFHPENLPFSKPGFTSSISFFCILESWKKPHSHI